MNRRLVILLTLLLCLCLGWQTVAASSEPISEEAYWRLVESAVHAIEANDEIDPIIEQLKQLESIQRDDELMTIDTAPIVALLQSDTLDAEEQIEQLQARLAIRDPLGVTLDETAIYDSFDAVLSRSEFQYENVLPEWLQRAAELIPRIFEFLFRIFEFGVESGTAPLVAWGITGIAVLGLLAFLWYWLRGVRRQFSSDSELDVTHDDADLISADAAFEQAEALAKSSDYRQAVRYLYLSTLLSLDERGLLRYDRSKTNREYLRSVAGSDVAPTLRSVVDVFDRVWYGFQPIDAASYEQYAAAVRRLRGA